MKIRDYDTYLSRARKDLEVSLNIWKTILMEILGERIQLLFAKGSAIKPWDSPIDYVPILGDLDIHILLYDNESIFKDYGNPNETALDISIQYERRFTQECPNYLHLPRSQIVHLNELLTMEDYVQPRPQDIRILHGEPKAISLTNPRRIKEIDLKRLLETKKLLKNLPMKLFDKSGLDYWVLIRRMNWQISPAPFRLLSQVLDIDPLEIWGWNRTEVTHRLEGRGYNKIANHYNNYYLEGWNAFLSKDMITKSYRQVIYHGFKVLSEILKEISS